VSNFKSCDGFLKKFRSKMGNLSNTTDCIAIKRMQFLPDIDATA